jgi:hypothetical protein
LVGRFNRNQLFAAAVDAGTNPIGEPEAVIFRRSVVPAVGGFSKDNPYLVDLDYWMRILAHGDGWANRETHAAFRNASGSASVSLLLKQPKLFKKFLLHHSKFNAGKFLFLRIKISIFKAYILSVMRGVIYLATLKTNVRR